MQDPAENLCIHQLFQTQANRTPDLVAVVFEDHQVTYKEINQRANRLAYYLRNVVANSNRTVGIYLNRSPNIIISILGVLKAGCAYVPLAPENPIERNRWILRDVRPTLILWMK